MRLFHVLAALLVASSVFPMTSLAAEKTSLHYIADDFDANFWAYNEIDDFLSADIIDGSVTYEDQYPVVTVNPDGKITRAQFTKMIVNALDLQQNGVSETFTDVKESDWYAPYVAIANSHGIIKGSNGKFLPKNDITREQMALMIYRAFHHTITFEQGNKTFTDIKQGTESAEAINKAAANDIVKGYGDLFKPKNLATRAQGIIMIHRALRQETSQLPTMEQLSSRVNEMLTKERDALISQNIQGLESVYHQYATGHFRIASLETVQAYDYMKNMGQAFQFEPVGDFAVNVLTANNRVATVSVNNLIYHVTIPEGGQQTTDMSGTVSLKKDLNGNWQIYNVILSKK
ncbi:S-layer homology domain-containing protein [Pseudoneobacillus sp. C159]